MAANQWNLFARRGLQGLEVCIIIIDTIILHIHTNNAYTPSQVETVPEVEKRLWVGLIAAEDVELGRVQSVVRGWRLRQHWNEIYNRQFQRKSLFLGCKEMALKREFLYWTGVKKLLWGRWNVYVSEYKVEQYYAATDIQAYIRMRQCSYWYEWMKVRIYTANTNYLPTAQRHHDAVLCLGFRHWHNMQQVGVICHMPICHCHRIR
jgi:hypothetical protein